MTRSEIEQAIGDEERALEQVALLIERRAPVATWPQRLRNALALALGDESISRPEHWKLVALRQHLFGAATPVPAELVPPSSPETVELRYADRLRAGLTARARFRSGVYLTAVEATRAS